LEGLLESFHAQSSEKKSHDNLENIFLFALIWAFGGPMVSDKSADYRKLFNEQFSITFGQKFPKEKLCFDYVWSFQDDCFVDWALKVPMYQPIPIGSQSGETPFSQLFVATSDTVRLMFLMDILARKGRHCMLVGSGSGKTSLINQYLGSLDKDVDGFLTNTINMSYYTDSKRLQESLELPIDKRSGTDLRCSFVQHFSSIDTGRRFGPPASKRLIFFIDDMNLPQVETYGTQNAIALLTQHMSYGTIFDRADLGLRKELVDIQYMAAMNPTAGMSWIS
jgi:dynein heavy chain